MIAFSSTVFLNTSHRMLKSNGPSLHRRQETCYGKLFSFRCLQKEKGKAVCHAALCVLFFHFRLRTQYRKYMHLRDRTFHRPSRYSNIDGSCQKPDARDARKSNRGHRHDEIVISFAKCRQIKKLPEIRLSASSGGSYSEIF